MTLLPASVASLSPDSLIELYEISNFNLQNPYDTLYFCNYQGVSFEGQSYLAIGCEGEGFDLIGRGALPQPTLVISNVGRIVSDWLYKAKTYEGYRLEGSTVRRRVTQAQFLDGGSNSDAAIKELPFMEFVIEQLEEETYRAIKLKLGTPFDVEGVTLPARPALRSCTAIYRNIVTGCPYIGAAMFDINNQPTLDPTKDVCSKSLSGCKARFGEFGIIPINAFLGLGGFG